MAAQQEAMELQPPSLSQLLDDDDSDGQEWVSDEEELQEMLQALSWSPEATCTSQGKTRRRACNDRYDEIEFLRNKVQHMEEELQTLRHQHVDNMAPVSPAPAATLAFSSQAFGFPVSSPPIPGAQLVGDLATHQQRWRERAARENYRLRMVLDTQANLA